MGISAIGLWLALSGAALASGDGPEISKHRGKKDGVIVLWPRVVPGDPQAEVPPEIPGIAAQVHQKLGQLAARVSDENRLVIRPEPERVCPQRGCRAVSLGAVLGFHEGGCFAVGLVGLPDGGQVRMVPWAGDVLASQRHVAHREAPESRLMVQEFVPCERLVASLEDAALERALQAAIAEDAGEPQVE